MLPLFLAYALIVLFLVVERLLRRGAAARTLASQPEDRGSTRLIGIAFAASMSALIVAAFLGAHVLGSLGSPWRWAGVGLMALGLLLRVWAARTLGAFYTRTLVVSPHQQLVEAGPYRWLRHPGYAGDIVLWLGAGLAAGDLLILAVIAVLIVPAYIYRIHVEEILLRQRFGAAFARYARTRRRVIPFVY